MSTRREFTEGSLAAVFAMFMAAWGSGTNTSGHAQGRVAFDPGRHEILTIGMMFSAGIDSNDDGPNPILMHMMFGDSLAEEHEWMRDRCRQQLYAVLDRLDAT